MPALSIVVPCLNEEDSIPLFYRRVSEVLVDMPGVSYEFVFVDDGSRDSTVAVVEGLRAMDGRVRFVSFTRNFGKEAAIYAGLSAATGDFVALMDADLQDPPELLPEMYQSVKDGEWENAATRRVSRIGEPPIRSFFARRFYRLINRLSNIEFVDGARDFRLMKRSMVDSILRLREYNRFSKGIFSWVGYSTRWFEFENVERVAGESKWSFWKLFRYSLEGIVAFSTAPLSIASWAGVLLFVISMCFAIATIVRTMLFGDPVAGWPSLVCLVTLIGGMQLLTTGIIGQYLAKTYLETKARPLYLVRKSSEG
jgi:glycosyltransferase involved in cell wall biosynthesis